MVAAREKFMEVEGMRKPTFYLYIYFSMYKKYSQGKVRLV